MATLYNDLPKPRIKGTPLYTHVHMLAYTCFKAAGWHSTWNHECAECCHWRSWWKQQNKYQLTPTLESTNGTHALWPCQELGIRIHIDIPHLSNCLLPFRLPARWFLHVHTFFHICFTVKDLYYLDLGQILMFCCPSLFFFVIPLILTVSSPEVRSSLSPFVIFFCREMQWKWKLKCILNCLNDVFQMP